MASNKVTKAAAARSARAKKAWKTRKRNAGKFGPRVVVDKSEEIGKLGADALNSAGLADCAMSNDTLTYMPPREGILREGIEKTLGSRNKAYGDPSFNFACTTEMKRTFWSFMAMSGKNSVQQNSPFGHAIDMVLTNLARIATSPTTHVERDRFVDAATYMAIAFEVGR